MIKLLFSIAFLLLALFASANDPIRALIITGGHKFDRHAFFEMFDSFENFYWTEAVQPKGNTMIEDGSADAFDILIFYDMYDSITDQQKEAYINLLKKGKPVIFLHHALVSYQDWQEFVNIIGGRFLRPDSIQQGSTYEHDVNIPVQAINKMHPVTQGLDDVIFFDETYGNCIIREGVQPLFTTQHPGNMPYVAWINKYGHSQIIYIQIGHGPQIFSDKNYRRLLSQAIRWSVSFHSNKSKSNQGE